ncbi:hypothetical protein WD_1244 [Wolbachia endosymbiont of Drosophila melanogaster]|uniref:hypothetical protein n=1 Tax=Wolbachia TaxID=953 RepID=UPI000023BCA3|nr:MULTISPECIES: hypothetical protein [Wolbachia]AAS14890.1 hypothetical protein WD_1244 [Wolbachia endosymbiont of Drosophila melanogaster]MDU8923008.1 hypothetical protein [Wolbachia endosymbiont of Drosophila seguyi]
MLANKSNTRRVLCQNTIGVTCKIDPSVSYSDDKKRSTGMTPFVVFNKVRT